jgi:hypothetical protein
MSDAWSEVQQEVALVARERRWAVAGAALSSQKRNRGGRKGDASRDFSAIIENIGTSL